MLVLISESSLDNLLKCLHIWLKIKLKLLPWFLVCLMPLGCDIIPFIFMAVTDAKLVLVLTLLTELLTCFHIYTQLHSHYVAEQGCLNELQRSLLPYTALQRHKPPHQGLSFWMRSDSVWCWNFEDELVIAEEWREHFCMSRTSLLSLSEPLRLLSLAFSSKHITVCSCIFMQWRYYWRLTMGAWNYSLKQNLICQKYPPTLGLGLRPLLWQLSSFVVILKGEMS